MTRLQVSSLPWGTVPCNGEQMNSAQARKYSCCLLSSASQSANMSYLALIRPESAQLPGKGVETPRLDPVWLPCSASKARAEPRASGLCPPPLCIARSWLMAAVASVR